MPRIVRVALYLRQSLDAKDDRAAVERQLKTCTRWCAERSTPEVTYTIVRPPYEDNDISATKGTRVRKAFTAMLADAKAGAFDLIVAYHLDRLTRTIRDLLPLLELATKHKVGTTTVSGELDLTTDMGRLVAGILAVVAQAEVDRKGARQILANQQRADAGDPHIGGARPVGYVRVERPKGEETLPKLALREDEAGPLRTAYTSVLAGRSCTAIARDLNAAGLRTTKRATKGQGAFTHNGVKTLLTNPLYAGLKVYQGEIVATPGNWERLVDESTWRSVRAILTDPGRTTNANGGNRRWLGTGIYRCGVCAVAGLNETVTCTYRAGGVRVYQCRTGKHLSRLADAIDKLVIAELCRRFARDDAKELLEDHDRPDLEALRGKALALKTGLDQAAADHAERTIHGEGHGITRSQFRIITDKLNAELETVEASMAHTDRSALLADYVLSDDPRAVWDGDTLDRQRAILASMLEVTIHRGRAGGNSRNGPRPLDLATVALHWL